MGMGDDSEEVETSLFPYWVGAIDLSIGWRSNLGSKHVYVQAIDGTVVYLNL